MQSSRTGTRILSLVFGFAGAWLISWVCDSTWDAASYYGLPPASPQPWLLTLIGMIELGMLWAVTLFWPALIGLVRRVNGLRPR